MKITLYFYLFDTHVKNEEANMTTSCLSSSPAVLQGHVLFGLPRARTRPPGETTSGTQTGLKNPMVINGV